MKSTGVIKEVWINNKKYQYTAFFLILFLVLMIILSGIIYTINHNNNMENARVNQFEEIGDMETFIHNKLVYPLHTLMMLTETKLGRQYLENGNQILYELLTDVLINTAQTIGIYDQLRLIDESGMETLRIDYASETGCLVTSLEALQDKSSRYYFTETMKRNETDYYISPFDLNVENCELELPYKPMIRVSKKMVNSGGETLGMAIVNINAQTILSGVSEMKRHSYDNLYLLNDDGYFLLRPETEDAFGFMFEGKEDVGFFSEFPEAWSQIQDQATVVQNDQGLFYIKQVNLIPDISEEVINNTIFIVMHVMPDQVAKYDEGLKNSLIFAMIVLSIFFLFISVILGKELADNAWYKKELVRNATTDNLTGLYNRRYIFEQINRQIKLANRRKEPLMVMFIDVNDLKKINDKEGHQMGDLMLVSAAQAMAQSIRETDLISRLGGDEFLLVLPNCKETISTVIQKRIGDLFAKAGQNVGGFDWNMSYGATVYNGMETADQLVDRADGIMYEYKVAFKANMKKEMD